MSLFLQLHCNTLADGRTVLTKLQSMILPRLSELILLVETHSRETLPGLGALRIRTENAEDCSLTTWHSWEIVGILRRVASTLFEDSVTSFGIPNAAKEVNALFPIYFDVCR